MREIKCMLEDYGCLIIGKEEVMASFPTTNILPSFPPYSLFTPSFTHSLTYFITGSVIHSLTHSFFSLSHAVIQT